MLFDKIEWEIRDNSQLGFIDFGKYCATIYHGPGLTTDRYPFEVRTYKKDEDSDTYLMQLGAELYLDKDAVIPKESRVEQLLSRDFLDKEAVEETLLELSWK